MYFFSLSVCSAACFSYFYQSNLSRVKHGFSLCTQWAVNCIWTYSTSYDNFTYNTSCWQCYSISDKHFCVYIIHSHLINAAVLTGVFVGSLSYMTIFFPSFVLFVYVLSSSAALPSSTLMSATLTCPEVWKVAEIVRGNDSCAAFQLW